MDDISVSKKIGEEYKTLITIKEGKYGPQLSFSPDAKKVFAKWPQNPEAQWLNMPIKVWGNQAKHENTMDDDILF